MQMENPLFPLSKRPFRPKYLIIGMIFPMRETLLNNSLSNVHVSMARHEYSLSARINSLVPLQSQKL